MFEGGSGVGGGGGGGALVPIVSIICVTTGGTSDGVCQTAFCKNFGRPYPESICLIYFKI